MGKKMKLNLKDLKIQSFVTSLSDIENDKLKGGLPPCCSEDVSGGGGGGGSRGCGYTINWNCTQFTCTGFINCVC